MRRLLQRRRVILVLTCLAGVSLTVAAVAATREGSEVPPPDSADFRSPSEPARVLRGDLFARFAIFRTRRDRRDRVARAAATDPNVVVAGGNPLGARFALERGGDKVWVIPTPDGACLVSKLGRTSACSPVADLLSGRNVSAVICAPSLPDRFVQVSGVMPDGVRAVTARRGSRNLRTYRVVNNVYVLNLRKSKPLPTVIAWSDREGNEHKVGSQLPADASESCSDADAMVGP